MSVCFLSSMITNEAHESYLNFFRVHQCQLHLDGKCKQDNPFTCFFWHSMNQRRRRAIRLFDGKFNYSPINYCTKYDEHTGICPDGDDCRLLHRTEGDTEHKYHPRRYKTEPCLYGEDFNGHCIVYGKHCPSAHGVTDRRRPTLDNTERPRNLELDAYYSLNSWI